MINCSNLGRKLIKQRSKITEKDFTYKLIVDKHKIISECVDVIEDHHIDNNSFSIDQDYLNWRYLKHPIFKYEMFLVKNTQSKEKILVILRLHECLDGAKIAHITDIIGRFSNFKFVTPFVDKYMEENQVSAVDFSCTKNSFDLFFKTIRVVFSFR